MPFTMMLVFIPNVVVAYVVAVSSGLSVAASLLLPWYDIRSHFMGEHYNILDVIKGGVIT